VLSAFAQERTVSGTVTDAKTGLPLEFVSVVSVRTGNGGMTDEKGYYSFSIYEKNDSIAISKVGYTNMKKAATDADEQIINFEATISSTAMEGVVVVGKSKYTRAQRLIMRVIKNKPNNDAYNNSTFQCRVYDKVELDVKNIPKRLQHSIFMKPLAFALKQMDSTKDGQKFLPLYLSESLADYYYKKSPFKERYDYLALKTSGTANQSVLTYIDGLYKGLNIYNDNIKLFKVNFVSPIADDALNFYKYHISDTLYFGANRCIQVQFSPIRYGSNAFEGYIWIVDTSYAVKSIVLHMDKSANINWVNKFELTQNFEPDTSKKYMPTRNMLYIDMNLPTMKNFGGIAKKTTVFKNVLLNNNKIDTVFAKPIQDTSLFRNSQEEDTLYWGNNRLEPLSKSEKFVYALVDTIQKIPIVKLYGKLISAGATGYYTAGKLDWGNLYNAFTSNQIEGNRFSMGFKTNKFLTKKFQYNNYIGYSTLDKKFRYAASTLFVLNKKPWSTLLISYTNDIASYSSHSDEVDENSIFASVLRRTAEQYLRLINNRQASIQYTKFFYDGFAINVSALNSILTPYFNVYYTYDGMTPYIVGQSGPQSDYKTNEISATIRYGYKEKYITQNYRRLSLSSNYPILSFTYTKGIKVDAGPFISNFSYNQYIATATQNFTDGRLGRLNYTLQGGYTQGILPIVLLNVQKGNDTYYYDRYAFNNMNEFEFVADKYISLHAEQTWGGFPFNRIPGIRKLKWRSLTTFNAVMGDMSEENKLANHYSDTSSTINYHFTIPNKTPYMEAGLGISNIFNVLRVDGIWRLTYRDNPDIPKFGLKVSLELKF